MGYSVQTSGRLRLAQQDEPRAHALLRARMLAVEDSGWLHDDEPTASLEELASFAAAQLTRQGDELVFVPDAGEDNKWSAQATAFWTGLGDLVHDGRIEVVGEDGCTWSYEFTAAGVVQRGANGWDGTGDGTGLPDDVFGAIPAVGGAGLMAAGNGGRIPLAVGVFHLLVGWRLSRPH